MKKTMKITIPQSLADQLEAKAKAESRSVSEIAERAIRNFMTKRRENNGR